MEYRILQQAADQGGPIGAGFLFNALQTDNNPILSEATLGRYLRSLEQRGYLASERYDGRSRGRVITEAGRRRLSELSLDDDRQKSIRAVMELLGENLDKQLRDMLVARKIVEPEMAALAAQSATEENMSAIRRILNQMDQLTAAGQSMAPTDGPFHAEIAKASGNSILESILKIATLRPSSTSSGPAGTRTPAITGASTGPSRTTTPTRPAKSCASTSSTSSRSWTSTKKRRKMDTRCWYA